MSRRKLLLLVGLVLLAAASCARPAQTDLQAVVDGRATPEEFINVTVTDSRTTDRLLVELSDGDVTIWAEGFVSRPARGSTVWTSITGRPVDDDVVGLVYPTRGVQAAPEEGLNETGAIAVIVGVLAALAFLLPALGAAFGRPKSATVCTSCGKRMDSDWSTCPSCGAAGKPSMPAAPASATIISSVKAPTPAPDPVEAEPAEASAPPVGGTRIFRRDD